MKISVIIPSYNRYTLLKRAVFSVYSQTYPPQEVIIIDDGSNDETSNIQKDFPSVKYFYQNNNGVSSARNLGIEKASFDWIAFLDSDDEWFEDKLQKQVNYHQENENISVSYTDEEWIRDGEKVKIPKKFKKIGKDAFKENLSYCNIAPSSVLIHKNIFQMYGLFDENLEVCEDYDLWLRVSLSEKIGLVNEKLIRKYAGHKEQLSFKYWGMDRFRVISLEKVFKIAKDEQKETIKKELFKKYSLLYKGAVKYDRIAQINLYSRKMIEYSH